MNITQAFLMAIKSIFMSKMRSFLTMLGVIIGVASVITLVSFVQGSQAQMVKMYEKMGTNKISVSYWSNSVDLTDQLPEFVKKHPDLIEAYTPNARTNFPVRYKNKNLTSTGIYFGNESFGICNNYELEKGRNLSPGDLKNRVKVAVIGGAVAKEFFGLSEPIGKKIKIKGQDYTVIGTYKSKFDGKLRTMDDMLLLPSTLQRAMTGSRKVTEFTVKAKNSESTTNATNELRNYFQPKFKSRYDYFNAYSDNEWMEQSNKQMALMSWIVGGIAGISLLVGGIGIMNIMLVSVTERTREIGIRMAIGARRRDIIIQFLIEAGTVSACGGVIGILLGGLGAAILSSAAMKTLMLPSMPIIIGAFLFSVLLGVFFGFYPANKASKMHPIEALRTQ